MITSEQVREVFDDIQEFGNLTQLRCKCCDERLYLTESDCQYIADRINEDIDDKKITLDDNTLEDRIRDYLSDKTD